MPFITQGKANIKYILIVVVLAAIVGGGVLIFQYWCSPKEEAKTPQSLVLPAEKFDPANIETVFTFYDSKGARKKIMVYNAWIEDPNKILYLTDDNLNKDSAVKITDLGLRDVSSFPKNNVSFGNDIRYIVIEIGGEPMSDIVIVEENGENIVQSVYAKNSQLFEEIKKMEIGWGQHGISFKEWVFKEGAGSSNEFIMTIGLANGSLYEATINVVTGGAIGGPKKIY